MKRLLLFFSLSVFSFPLLAQSGERGAKVLSNKETETKGNTYAVIMGISTYQNINKLQYADRDAKNFYDFLRSKSGGSVDSSNINLMLNSQARRANMNRAIVKWLIEGKKPQKGDKVYIYFAGHGDAIPGVSSFLLGWDVPNTGDPSVDYDDNGGIIVEELKRRVKLMTANGATVILITDACRGNEVLSGGEKGKDDLSNDLLASDMEAKSGELQFTSCSTGEVSREDKIWGGGRGLFSYWFVNGLYGLADKDGDGIVTAGELSEYVKDKVKQATKRIDANGEVHYDQKPFYCCSENDDDVLARVDLTKKQEIEASIQDKANENQLLPSGGARGFEINFSGLSDSVKFWYNSFENEIQNDTSISSNWKGYLTYYAKLVHHNIPEKLSASIRDELIIALYNHSQQVMNFYLEAKRMISDSSSQKYFTNAVVCLDTAMVLMDKSDELFSKIKRNKLILEVLTTIHSSSNAKVENKLISQKLIDAAFKNLDMARELNSRASAILYHTYALLYQYECNYREAIKNDSEAIHIAPKWTFALSNLGTLYDYLFEYENAEKFYRKSLKFDSSYTYSLMGLGHSYFRQKKYAQAETYYLKALQSDSTNISLLHDVEYFYKSQKEFDNMQKYYIMEAKVNPGAFKDLGDFYNEHKQFDQAEKFYYLYLKSDSSNIKALYYFGSFCYRQKEYDKAAHYCLRIVQLDTKNTDAFTELGYIYTKQKQYSQAEQNFENALQIDKNLLNALTGLGNMYEDQKQYDKAEDFYYRALKTNPSFADISYRLACCYSLQGDEKKALKSLEKAINDGYYDYENIQQDPGLNDIRSSSDFKAIMKKYFPDKYKGN